MKLSTNKLFTAQKNSPKMKPKIKHAPKLSSPLVAQKYNSNFNSNYKKNKYISTTSLNENPFKKPQIHPGKLKSKIMNKMDNSNKKNTETDDLFESEDSYINNVIPTSESESNRHEIKIQNENIDMNNAAKNIDVLCDLFRKSNLKTTIIIDNKGNNNLDFEQKKIIFNYFNTKNKNKKSLKKIKINSNKIQKNSENNNGIIKKTSWIDRNKSKKQNLDKFNFKSNKVNKNRKLIKTNMFNNKLLSKKDVIKNNIIDGELFDIFDIKKIEEKSETEGNSVFESFTQKSNDSSFLGSSLDDEFYKSLADKTT